MTPSTELTLAAATGIGYGMPNATALDGAAISSPVRRRFIRVHGRGVHYYRAGEGPPVVLLHSAMSSARAELPLLHQLKSDHTVFAFDIPGMGDSDPLGKRGLRIGDAADALQATLEALQIPRCPIYGSHTGGVIALELARRHPECISALIKIGVHIFSAREAEPILAEEYRPVLTVKDDGSQLLADWTRSRDLMTWFPPYVRRAANRLPWKFPTPGELHDHFLDRARAGNGYRAIYGAVLNVCMDERKAVSALTLPATFMADTHDILFRHLDRMPKLRPNQHVVRYTRDPQGYVAEKARVARSYRVEASSPPDLPFRPTPGRINRRYVDLTGGQILVRSVGEARSGPPVLLLHDGLASSRVFEPLMCALGIHRAVYALDLPDNGASDALAQDRPRIGHYADIVSDVMNALGFERGDILAVGAGGTVALDLLNRPACAGWRGVLEAPNFYEPALARRLEAGWAPSMAPEWDGAHLNRMWLMMRDEYAFWPWFDKSPEAARAVNALDSWEEMHARAIDVLRSLRTYHRLIVSSLQYDWAPALRRAGPRVLRLAIVEGDPRRVHTEAAARVRGLPAVAVLPSPAARRAREILRLLSRWR